MLYGYDSKNGYGSLRNDPDVLVWNEGVTQMISKDFYLFKGVWIGALGVWNTGMDCLRGMDRDLTF